MCSWCVCDCVCVSVYVCASVGVGADVESVCVCVSVWRASVPPRVCVNVKNTEDGTGSIWIFNDLLSKTSLLKIVFFVCAFVYVHVCVCCGCVHGKTAKKPVENWTNRSRILKYTRWKLLQHRRKLQILFIILRTLQRTSISTHRFSANFLRFWWYINEHLPAHTHTFTRTHTDVHAPTLSQPHTRAHIHLVNW